jgi:SAM-dependent methyltransferase
LAADRDIFGESDAYEKFMGRWSRRLAPLFVRFATIAEGSSVLDVGSGTGELSFALVDAVPSVRVTAVDPSAAYVRYAQQRNRSDRVRFRTGDAQSLDMPDASFDAVVSSLALNFIPDRAGALREMHRVTKPQGIVAAAVWDYGSGMEMLRVFWDEAVALDPSIAPRDEGHMPLSKPGELAALWDHGGLSHVDEQPITIDLPFSSFEDYWDPFLGGQGPAGGYLVSLPGAKRDALEARLRTRLLGAQTDGPFTLRARAWAVRGIVSSDAGPR